MTHSDTDPHSLQLRLESKHNAVMIILRQRDQLQTALELSQALVADLSAEVKRLKAERELPPMMGGWY